MTFSMTVRYRRRRRLLHRKEGLPKPIRPFFVPLKRKPMNRTFLACLLSAILGGIVATWLVDPNAHWPGEQPAHAQVAAPPAGPAVNYAPPQFAAAGTIAPTQLTPEELTNIRVYEVSNRGVVNINTKFESYERFFTMMVPPPGQGSGS